MLNKSYSHFIKSRSLLWYPVVPLLTLKYLPRIPADSHLLLNYIESVFMDSILKPAIEPPLPSVFLPPGKSQRVPALLLLSALFSQFTDVCCAAAGWPGPLLTRVPVFRRRLWTTTEIPVQGRHTNRPSSPSPKTVSVVSRVLQTLSLFAAMLVQVLFETNERLSSTKSQRRNFQFISCS